MTVRSQSDLEALQRVGRLVGEALEHMTAAEIPAGQPLFGEGLGLDSVDALELALALQKQYAIHIESDVKHARQHFATIASLADFVQSQHKPCAD